MILKVIIILLASDDEGITLKLHSQGRLLARLVAKNLQWGWGLLRRCETKLKQVTLAIGTDFFPKLGEEGLYLDLDQFFAQSCVKTKKDLRPG